MRIIIICFCLCIYNIATACDVCVSNNNSTSFGILPNQFKHFVCLSYSNVVYKNADMHTKAIIKDRMSTMDVSLRYSKNKKWQFTCNIPVMQYQRVPTATISNTALALRDASIGGFYTVLNKQKKQNHFLQIGLQVGLPTGSNNVKIDNEKLPANMQGGTYGVENIANYIVHKKNRGIMLGIGNKIILSRNNNYQIGTVNALSASGFAKIDVASIKILLISGLSFTTAMKDKFEGKALNNTGANILKLPITAQFFYKKMMLSGNIESPIYQNINNNNSTLKNSTSIKMAYLF
jgi:hypothetical protein